LILTPDQRVRVFISSTLGELAAERSAVRRAITRLHLVPVWYESGARPHPPRSMYRAYLNQSQVFVGIYWQRYGWVAPGMEISGLEDEYRLAAGKRGPTGKLPRRRLGMSDPDPEIAVVLAAYAAFARGDIDQAVAGLDAQVEWVEPEEFPYGGQARRPGRGR
jgi:hypothetical protein